MTWASRGTAVFDERWATPSGHLAVEIQEAARKQMEKVADAAHPNETGGVLIGYYAASHHLAVVTEASPPPGDSSAGRFWFRRGHRGLADWFRRLWGAREQRYYLGEWHYHPSKHVEPSHADIIELRAIADDIAYQCPEPIMTIVGMPQGRGRQAVVIIAVRGGTTEYLQPQTSGT